MHVSLLFSSRPPAPGPARALLERAIAWLRLEVEQRRAPEQVAALRQELGYLEELAGRDSVAVRDLLASVNALPSFAEPLERLIAIVERHRSFKHLPTLLEHLCRTADTPHAIARARVARAWWSLRHRDDAPAALSELEVALAAAPDDPPLLLTLELTARRMDRRDLVRRALTARAALAPNEPYSTGLLLERAELEAEGNELSRARATLEELLEHGGSESERALERLEELARRAHDARWLCELLERRARLAEGATGTPRVASARSLDVLLRTALLKRRLGDSDGAARALERARQLDPGCDAVAQLALRVAAQRGDHEAVEQLADGLLGVGYAGSAAAALWIWIAEARRARGMLPDAADALEHAVSEHPHGLLARALTFEVLSTLGDSAALGRALERLAGEGEPRARARLALLAAEHFARGSRSRSDAERALALARAAGVSETRALRVARALAHASHDAAWLADATRALAEASAEPERARLELELLRRAALADDPAALERHARALSTSSEHAATARLLAAYPLSSERSASARAESLDWLAERERDPERALALAWAAAREQIERGALDEARALLSRSHARAPSDAVVAGALSVLDEASPELDARLRASAGALSDPVLAASLWIESGLRAFRAGARAPALADFEAADRALSGSAHALGVWARRAEHFDTDAGADAVGRVFAALGRLTLEPEQRSLRAAELAEALAAAEHAPLGLADAAELSLTLLPAAEARAPDLGRSAAPTLLETARALEHARALERRAAPEEIEASARAWAAAEPSLPAALAWLASTLRTNDIAAEVEARRQIADLLPPPARALVLASAAQLGALAHDGQSAARLGSFAGDEQAAWEREPALALIGLETAPPGSDPRRRSAALLAVGELLGDEDRALSWLLAAYNQLALGERELAAAGFRRYATAFPDDPMGWEGLLACADERDDPVLIAEATAALANATSDPRHAAELFERAADIFFDELEDAVAGEAALVRAAELDIERRSSFERLLARLRERGEGERLLEWIERRLPSTALTPEERVELTWESARLLRSTGDTLGAKGALDELLRLAPDHVGGLLLLGEIHITEGRYDEAAAALSRVVGLEAAPPEQRLTSGITSVDLYEDKLGQGERALDVLRALARAGLGATSVRERLARASARASAWDEAARVLEELMLERETPRERAEAARLALAIHRDRREQPSAAARAAETLLSLEPADPEALDLVLGGHFDPDRSERLLEVGQRGLLAALTQAPTELERVRLLVRVAEHRHDLALLQVSLGALLALGYNSAVVQSELERLERRLRHVPLVALPADALRQLAEPADSGPLPALIESLGGAIVRALGPTAKTFDVSRKNRIAPESGLPLREDVAAWAGAFELGDFDLHRAQAAPGRIRVIGTQPALIVAGPGVEGPLTPTARMDVVREIYAAKRGVGFLLHHDPNDAAALIVALLELGGRPIAAPPYARLEDFKRRIGRALSRGERKALAASVQGLAPSAEDIVRWVEACVGSLDRIAALAVGDPSWLVANIENRPRGDTRSARELSARSRRVLSFVLSAGFTELRERLGMTRR